VRFTVLVVGRVRGILEPAVREFEVRAGRYWKLEVVEVEAGAGGGSEDAKRVRAAEAERIRARLPERGELWTLTRGGRGMSSRELARELEQHAVLASPGITFVIGGAFGLAEDLLRTATRSFSLSPMTLPHEMARLILAEQLYKAGTILRNEPYHKGGP